MKMPLGRPNCRHSAMNLPVLVEDLDAVVLAVADEQPAARIHRDRVRLAELARAVPFLPHSLRTCRPCVNFMTRLFLPLRWPSVTKMSPFGATTTSVG